MSAPSQAKVLLATLTECTSGRGPLHLRGLLGASDLVAFAGKPDERGRPTWNLYLVERPPRDGAPANPGSSPRRSPQPRRPIPPASAGARAEPPNRQSTLVRVDADHPQEARR